MIMRFYEVNYIISVSLLKSFKTIFRRVIVVLLGISTDFCENKTKNGGETS